MVCNSPALKLYVDTMLNNGLSNLGIASGIVDMGGKMDPDVIGRHKNNHWVKPERKEGPKPTNRDLAILMRDKVVDAVEEMTPEALLYFGKDIAPVIGKGLQAQQMLDKRAAVRDKNVLAAGALSLQLHLAGLRELPPPPELDDGMTIEGEAVELSSS